MRGIKRSFCLTSVWRLSVAYIGNNSRTESPKKTKIGTQVAHVTRDSEPLSRSEGQRSRSQGQRHIVEASRLYSLFIFTSRDHHSPHSQSIGTFKRKPRLLRLSPVVRAGTWQIPPHPALQPAALNTETPYVLRSLRTLRGDRTFHLSADGVRLQSDGGGGNLCSLQITNLRDDVSAEISIYLLKSYVVSVCTTEYPRNAPRGERKMGSGVRPFEGGRGPILPTPNVFYINPTGQWIFLLRIISQKWRLYTGGHCKSARCNNVVLICSQYCVRSS